MGPRPLYMLAKLSGGLQDSVPGTFPPGRPEDEAQDRGSQRRAPEPELAGEASPSPVDSGTLDEGSAHRRAWRGLVKAHELSHVGEAYLGPLGPRTRRLAKRWAGGQSIGQGFPPWPRARMGKPRQGTLQAGFSKPQLGHKRGSPNQHPTRSLRPVCTPGNPSEGLRDPVTGYLPPSRTEDKAQASGYHPGSCHSPGLGARAR
ncbi:hypothetical protein NDU88_006852 [Pleurodeles waltl]|uniref:Uncharacterized protein n=1 Tax=Pleurodeles waltl TaxID=8319 RepID=A0AAV7PKU4_PLEWA|nr:hypothetical protein NDU88_006852 [Pleurodeles waltl]